MSVKYFVGVTCSLFVLFMSVNCLSDMVSGKKDSGGYQIRLVVKTRQPYRDHPFIGRERYPDIRGVVEISGYRFELPENAKKG